MIVSKSQTNQLVAFATCATIFVVTATYYSFYRRRKSNIPTKWKRIAKVENLFLYPLKSGRRREVQRAACTELGLSIEENNFVIRDRSFVVYGENNSEYIAGKTYPKLVLVQASVDNEGEVIFTAPGQEKLVVKIPENKESINITLYAKEPCETVDCGDEAAQWLSNFLLDNPVGVRLGYHNTEYRRDIRKCYSHMLHTHGKLKDTCMGLYQNLTTYLLVNQHSIDDLKSKIEEDVSANNFRPNILVRGDDGKPYVEENWDWVKIGDAIFRNVKPSTRCSLIALHPEKGAFTKGKEPFTSLPKINSLKKLSHIKLEGKKGVMGIHLTLSKVGNVNIGDVVYVA